MQVSYFNALVELIRLACGEYNSGQTNYAENAVYKAFGCVLNSPEHLENYN